MPKSRGTNRSTEDYLKAICTLEHGGGTVTTSALAQQLGLTAASVTGMIKTLSRKGLVRYERYRGVALTHAGRRMALTIVRRHRLWEMFLVKYLGFGWDEIHEEAERLEHATSEVLEAKLDRALGFPPVDPHGDPIPTVDGVLDEGGGRTLADSTPGAVIVTRVTSADPALLKYAAALGIRIRKRIWIKETVPVDGSLRIRIGGRDRFISAVLARHIFVEHGRLGRRT
jgi:DtxR family Mn-dependent transcriptional regulator